MLECCQRHAKIDQHSKLKTALLVIWSDLPQEFIDKAIVSFHSKLRPVLLQLVDIVNAVFKY